MLFEYHNENPVEARVGDCTVRAIAFATDQSWEKTYWGICFEGYIQHDMPSANSVWGAYLIDLGFERFVIPNTCPSCYTVKDFCRDNPKGTFILATGSHVVGVKEGRYFDTWNSGNEVPIYYYKRKD